MGSVVHSGWRLQQSLSDSDVAFYSQNKELYDACNDGDISKLFLYNSCFYIIH